MRRIWVPIGVVMVLAVCGPPGFASETPEPLPTRTDRNRGAFYRLPVKAPR